LLELKEKYPALNHRYLASVVPAYNVLILSKVPINVAGQLLGVFPILV